MNQSEKSKSWVVYRMTLSGKKGWVNAVCDQSEWDALERSKPGYHALIRSGITNEGEAEQLARAAVVAPVAEAV